MKKNLLFAAVLFLTYCFQLTFVFGQSPERMSYQAVIRNTSNQLVANAEIGMKISILQGSASGTTVYAEIFNPNPHTNANGLVSVEIGGGIPVSGSFQAIDWARGPYFIKTETDPNGGTSYTITGISQMLSVPYALHAGKAQSLADGESDPLWKASPSFGISMAHISNWNSAFSWGNHADAGYLKSFSERDPLWSASPSFGITNSQIADWNSALMHSTTSSGSVHGSTTVGGNLFRLTDPSAVSFLRLNDDNSVTALNADDFRAAIGAGTGNGTVTSISTINGITGGPIHTTGTIGLVGQAYALHNLNDNGLIARAGAGTVAAREIKVSGSGINISNGDGSRGDPTITLDIGKSATQVAAGNHTHGNISDDGQIGAASGRIITTGLGGTLQATAGTEEGEMLYWNGSAWVKLAAGINGQSLVFINGKPTWWPEETGTTNVVNPTTGRVWMDRNLGASDVANSSADASSYGYLYQWGRDSDGHQIRTSAITSTKSSTDKPGHNKFIIDNDSGVGEDWRLPHNDDLWQGETNNPCPRNFRVPTEAEWEAERLTWHSNNADGAFRSWLKLPLAGYRTSNDGSLENVGGRGYYWSSTAIYTMQAGPEARYLHITSSDADIDEDGRARGHSVRCIKY